MPTIVNNVETIAPVAGHHRDGRRCVVVARPSSRRRRHVRIYGISGHVKKPGCLRGARSASRCASSSRTSAAACCTTIVRSRASSPAARRRPVLRPRRQGRRAQRRPPAPQVARHERDRRPDGRRHLPRARHDARDLLRHRHGRHGQHGRGLPKPHEVLQATSPAVSARPAARARGGSSTCSTTSSTGRGKPEDVDLLVDISNNMMGNTICAFADGTAMPMLGLGAASSAKSSSRSGAPHGPPTMDAASTTTASPRASRLGQKEGSVSSRRRHLFVVHWRSSPIGGASLITSWRRTRFARPSALLRPHRSPSRACS